MTDDRIYYIYPKRYILLIEEVRLCSQPLRESLAALAHILIDLKYTERRAFVGHQVLKTWDPPRDRVTHLLQVFPSPANGVHLPADLPLLLIGQDGVERPRIRTAVPGTGDLRAKKQNKIHQRNDKNSLHHSVTEQSPHLSSCGVIAPLDVELWRGREQWTLKLKDILAALEAHDWDSVAVLVRTSAVSSMLFTSSMYAFISAL